MDIMQKNYGGRQDTCFLLRDLYNFFARKKKKSVEGCDAEYVLNHMLERQKLDLDFYFDYCTDEEGHLKNIFWSDGQSQLDFRAFGDVVVFDSTYRVNKYNLPFIPFVGVDHRKTVVFGCGLLSDESVSSYVWLPEAFRKAMQQRHPLSLITDGDYAVARAIQIVFPHADHRLCSWHMERNMVSKLRGTKLRDFRKFIYHEMDVEEFERRWLEFMETHNVTESDIWIMRMYKLRKKWSAAYAKGRRFLGMRSNQRSESLNSKLHLNLHRRMSLVDLVEHYEFIVTNIRLDQLELDGKAETSIRYTNISADLLEKNAARIFTKPMFKKVRVQIHGLCDWDVAQVTVDNGRVIYEVLLKKNSDKRFLVACTFDQSAMLTASCECRMMECQAFPCAHMFGVMRYLNMDKIPPCCVNRRWTWRANRGFSSDTDFNSQVWSERMERFRDLHNKASIALFRASRSVEGTDRVMSLLDDMMKEDRDDEAGTDETFFAPLPALFSGARRASRRNVLDPKKIITKGA